MNLEFGTIRAAGIGRATARSRWQPTRARLRRRLHTSLLLLDVACIFFGFFIASLIYGPGSMPEQWLLMAAVFSPIYVGSALNAHAYAAECIQSPGRGVRRALQAFLIAAATVLLVAFCLKVSDNFSRVMVVLGSAITLLVLAVMRDQFLRKALRILGGNPFSAVLITDGTHPISSEGFSLVISTDDLLNPSDDTPGMFDRLAAALGDADRVVVACAPERRNGWVRVLKGAAIRSEVLAPEVADFAPLGLSHWGDSPTLVVAEGPLSAFDSFVKRTFDIVCSSIALLILSPLLIAAAIAIKLESPGPIFFVQTRIGQSNRQFKMLKFRSMRSDRCDANANVLTAKDDDRVTRVGKFIRRTSIDELPQLINILLGDMSVVGPRPHALGARAANKLYWEVDERYWHRHAAKPGLTGLAQVRGHRGATTSEQHLTDRLQADLEYLSHWTIWKDLKILLMTVRVVIHSNAY